MQRASEIVISDTSCLILLSSIDEIGLLRGIAGEVYITSVILEEFNQSLPSWIAIKDPQDRRYQSFLEMDLDRGEASAIALSLELKDSIVILDDLKGRKVADRLGLRYSGTFGLILRAKHQGIIQSVKPILEKIKGTNFRFTDELFDMIIRQAGE